MGPTLAFDQQYKGIICGIDEAGRGPWAGPVVAAAVIWPEGMDIPEHLNDSKKLNARKREALFDIITEKMHYGVGVASAKEIDQLNILRATQLAMTRSYEALGKPCDVALIDGNQPPQLFCKSIPVIKGDALSPSIAAASIIAKVTRDRIMAELGQDYPAYGFEKHAGYGTKQHQEALAAHGVTPQHRRSFAPIRKLLQEQAA